MRSRWNLHLGSWLGIPVFLHWSWLLMLAFIIGFYGPMMSLVYVGVFFLVLLHEYGHCIAAKRYGTVIHDITLLPIGGAARMDISRNPREELVVALAGPAVNLVLMPVFYYIGGYHELLEVLGFYNMVLLLFNLIPGFPMDGGRVVRALIAMAIKNYAKATLIAGRIGQGVAILFVIFGLMNHMFMLAFIGLFVFMAAQQEIEATRFIPAESTMSHTVVSDIQARLDDIERRYGQ